MPRLVMRLITVQAIRASTFCADRVRARTLSAQKVEARIACVVINHMTSLGMPISRKVA